jgi:membrane protein DedA with SNARE-associated domain
LRRWIKRSKLLLVSDLEGASGVFEHHGGKAILVGHLIPGVGALVSVPAGLKRMPLRWRFLGYTVLGCTLWNGTLIGLGWALGRRWRIVELYTSFVGLAVLTVLILAALWLLWRRWKARG